jgi:uncharacterized membrane protein
VKEASQTGAKVRPSILKIFLTGLLTILPLAATVAVLAILVGFAYEWLGPSSLFGKILIFLGFGTGEIAIARYFVGLALVGVFIFIVGVAVERGLQRGIKKIIDSTVARIPIVKTVYETAGVLVGILSPKKDREMGGMQPVWCRFGHSDVLLLALLVSPDEIFIKGKPFYAVIVPTAPVPVGGGLFFMPVTSVERAGIGVDELTSIYVSMGLSAPQLLAAK